MPSLQAQVVYDGVILDHPNRWDGYPVHLFIGEVHHIWFCAQSPITFGDAIYHSTNTSLAATGGWSTPMELFDVDDVPWAAEAGGRHACDPTVILGDFDYMGVSYDYALYFTSDTTPTTTGNNAIGVAFSNDGVDWVIHDQPIILPDGGYDGTYGAGAGGVAWGPDLGTIAHVYRDSTTSAGTEHRIRYKESTDGLSFSPVVSLDTLMSLASPSAAGSAPEIAFYPTQDRWFGAIQAIAGGDPVTGRLIRAVEPSSAGLFSSWETMVGLDGSTAGEELLLLPSMAKVENSSLYVTPAGWTYLFVTVGNHPTTGDGVFTWKVGQARYRLFTADAWVLWDSFQNIGQTRLAGAPLDDLVLETGAPTAWSASTDLVLEAGGVVSSANGGDPVATVPYDFATQASPRATVAVRFDASGSQWVATGFSASHAGLFGGMLWAYYNPSSGRVAAFANGLSIQLFDEPVAADPSGIDELRLVYDEQFNTLRVYFNGSGLPDGPVELDLVGFTPEITRAGFQMHLPTAATTRIESFHVNAPNEIFADGFESGDLSNWLVELN